MREQWLQGLRHALSEQCYPDGSPAQRQSYEQGKLKGEVERWLPDGRAVSGKGKPQSRMSKWTERL